MQIAMQIVEPPAKLVQESVSSTAPVSRIGFAISMGGCFGDVVLFVGRLRQPGLYWIGLFAENKRFKVHFFIV
jgi:hypothetical protein